MKIIFTFLLIGIFSLSLTAQCDNSWLNIKQGTSCVDVGNLVVTGNKITVEATFSRDALTTPVGTISVDLVSKHSHGYDDGNVNYLLRIDHVEMNAGGKFYATPSVPCLENTFINTTYHAAMVYDGVTLTFYRDGIIMSQVPASGDMATDNSVPTRIGSEDLVSNSFDPTLIGYMNNVRIWNRALTQSELQANMKIDSLGLLIDPIPANLLGYYNFGSAVSPNGASGLLNRAGPDFNGTIGTIIDAVTVPTVPAPATIGATNPYCVITDPCMEHCFGTLTSFTATPVDNKNVKLSWHADKEIGINSYIIQRATKDSNVFARVITIAAKGNTLTNDYSTIDYDVTPNIIYNYRLAIQRKNGTQSLSYVRSATITKSNFNVAVLNTPTNNAVKLMINGYTGMAKIKVMTTTGQVVSEQKISSVNTSTTNIDISKQPSGSYWIVVETTRGKVIKTVVKL